MLIVKILTPYPEMFPGVLNYSVIGKALKENKWSLEVINLHDFGFDKRKSIDDSPFGGGPGIISNIAASRGLAVFVEVVNRMHFRDASATELPIDMWLQFAKSFCKSRLICRCQVLVPQHQNLVAAECFQD